ncbi:30S ribosomal protein S4 [Candidatus Nomurabacteria bacterium RIFCSPLOWO2_01_FULL_36_10b]|uniref:Small ribosomal subunit protein uS4 n=1 Tax=Candidatus Nomurabacteria bacterium RIFCSPLOWO2_01_FULL_36_10b TaxID=1801766 RepID=A0A1F6WNU3_9BACT|nr:MAG: 30S ribosomal protein S4 [Candidatus Nomurabacteria bacterium RIFCSPLOWO2_01_FULL_36_10b]
MYQEKKYKIARRLGAGVFERCQTPKFAASEARRSGSSKGGGSMGGPRRSEYGLQLIDKQRVRIMYGITEKQFRNYVIHALESSQPARTLLELLEMRLDNTIYRLGLAPTRRMARQIVSHGHCLVNDKRTTIPSYSLSKGDIISVRKGSMKTSLFSDVTKFVRDSIPSWLSFDMQALKGTVKGNPTDPDPFLNLQSVIEFYSR